MLKKMMIMSVLSTLVLSGCSTLSSVKNAQGSGLTRVYNKDFNTVWNATSEVVRMSGLSVVSDDKATGEILAEKGMSAFSYGENVAVFVKEIDKLPQTQVEVVSKRVLATNVLATDWDDLILKHLDTKLLY